MYRYVLQYIETKRMALLTKWQCNTKYSIINLVLFAVLKKIKRMAKILDAFVFWHFRPPIDACSSYYQALLLLLHYITTKTHRSSQKTREFVGSLASSYALLDRQRPQTTVSLSLSPLLSLVCSLLSLRTFCWGQMWMLSLRRYSFFAQIWIFGESSWNIMIFFRVSCKVCYNFNLKRKSVC